MSLMAWLGLIAFITVIRVCNRKDNLEGPAGAPVKLFKPKAVPRTPVPPSEGETPCGN